MTGKQFNRINIFALVLLTLGLMFSITQFSYAQERKNPGSGLGALKAMGYKKPRGPSKNKIDSILRKKPKKSVDKDCVGKLQVNIAGSPSVVRAGQSYSFVALSKGGCKGTYKYMWSGRNLDTNTGKATGLLNRNNMRASFRNPGTSTVSVVVVDSMNNKASDRIVLTVLPKRN